MQKKTIERSRRVKIYGSPSFAETPAISAGDIWAYSFDPYDDEAEYAPFNSLVVQNQSSADIKIKIENSPDNAFLVASGTSRVLEPEMVGFFKTFVVENLDGSTAISSGDLTLEVARQAMDADTKARQDVTQGQASNIIEKFTGIKL